MSEETFQRLAAEGHTLIPVVREVLSDLDTPLSVYLKLADGPHTYLFESVEGGERSGFVLGEDLVLRKFKLLDGAVEQLESSERDDIRAELDARFALMAGEFKRLFNVLESALKLSKAD